VAYPEAASRLIWKGHDPAPLDLMVLSDGCFRDAPAL